MSGVSISVRYEFTIDLDARKAIAELHGREGWATDVEIEAETLDWVTHMLQYAHQRLGDMRPDAAAGSVVGVWTELRNPTADDP